MKNLILSFVLLSFFACTNSNSNSGSNVVKPLSGEEYKFEDIPGLDIKRVTQYDTKMAVIAEGFTKNGIKTGEWVEYGSKKGKLSTITAYVEGKLNGNYFEFDDRGYLVTQASFINDQLDGKVIKYKYGKAIEISNYKKGLLHGKKSLFHRNGNLQEEIDYNNDVIDGSMKFYNESGDLTMEYTYKNGEKIGGGKINKDIDNTPK